MQDLESPGKPLVVAMKNLGAFLATGTIHTSMPIPSFHAWLEHRLEEVPDAAQIALLIAQSGTAGVSRDALLRVIGTSPETLENMLRALVTARQVVMVRVGGEMVYRAAM